MAKIVSALILVVVIITVQGQAPAYEEVVQAAKAGNWEQVQELEPPYDDIQASYNEDDVLKSTYAKQAAWKPPSFDSLRQLKPENGGHVYGEAEYSFHSTSNVNGKTSEEKAGHKIINDDGRVKEFDFTPSTDISPLLRSIISPIGQKAGDYNTDYHYQYGGVIAGKPSFPNGKINNNLQAQDYYPRNSANLALPPNKIKKPKKEKKDNVTKTSEAEYEYVLVTDTDGDKPAREINVSEENKYNILHDTEQEIETAQTSGQTPVAYQKAGEEENNNSLKYNIDFNKPHEAKTVTTNDNENSFEIGQTTEPDFLLRVANVGVKLTTTPPTPDPAEDYIYNIPPVFLEEDFKAHSKENKIKKINNEMQIVLTFGEKPTDKPTPVTPRLTDVPTPPRSPISNLFSNIDYMANPAQPGAGNSVKRFGNKKQAKHKILRKLPIKRTTLKSTRHATAKKSKIINPDYIALVASAIEDRLDRISQNLKKTNFSKLNEDIFTKTKNTMKKQRSQKFLDPKPWFPKSFDKNFAYKNSSSYLDSDPPRRSQKKQFRASTQKWVDPLTFTDVRDLKPPQGGHVYGEAQYAYHTASNINGQKSEDSGGHKIINNDGKVKEFDFTPKPKFGPMKKLPSAVLDKDIGALKSLFLQ